MRPHFTHTSIYWILISSYLSSVYTAKGGGFPAPKQVYRYRMQQTFDRQNRPNLRLLDAPFLRDISFCHCFSLPQGPSCGPSAEPIRCHFRNPSVSFLMFMSAWLFMQSVRSVYVWLNCQRGRSKVVRPLFEIYFSG